MANVDLRVDWCSYKAAKYAMAHWHYSGIVPAGKCVHIGVWEAGAFIGVVIFGSGVAPYAAMQYGLDRMEMAELVRVGLTGHQSQVTQIISKAIALLKGQSPNLRLLSSYADPEHNHHGGIYQAGNWIYVGTIRAEWFQDCQTGNRINTKTLRTGRRGYATELKRKGVIESIYLTKHKYLYPLDRKMRRQIEPLAQPYPKREICGQGVKGDAAGFQLAEAGSIPAVRSESGHTGQTPALVD